MKEEKQIVASLSSVTKKYGKVTALNNVNMNVRAGELLAVLGPNGAGKTTAVRLMLGLIQAACGAGGGVRSRSAHGFSPGSALAPCCR